MESCGTEAVSCLKGVERHLDILLMAPDLSSIIVGGGGAETPQNSVMLGHAWRYSG